MSECNIKFTIKKKRKSSVGKKILKILSIIISIIIILCLLFLLLIGGLSEFGSDLLIPIFLVIILVKFATAKYKEYDYTCKAIIDITDNSNVIFLIKDFQDENNKIYDLKIILPINNIDSLLIDNDAYEKEVVGGNISGYPILEKKGNDINEVIDCSITKEDIFVIYEFKKNIEIIDRLQKIRR